MPRILTIGDVMGRPGRAMLELHLAHVREAHAIDLVIANAENSAHGFGMSASVLAQMRAAGVDVFSGGNHTLERKETIALLQDPSVLRPTNYPEGTPGQGVWRGEVAGVRVGVINPLFASAGVEGLDDAFRTSEPWAKTLSAEGRAVLVDIRSERTAEKVALFRALCPYAAAVWGTHTHVGTDDLMIEGGCGYVTDLGMSGFRGGVIGVESAAPIARQRTAQHVRFVLPESGPSIFQAVVWELDSTGRCVDAYKLRALDDAPQVTLRAYHEKGEASCVTQ